MCGLPWRAVDAFRDSQDKDIPETVLYVGNTVSYATQKNPWTAEDSKPGAFCCQATVQMQRLVRFSKTLLDTMTLAHPDLSFHVVLLEHHCIQGQNHCPSLTRIEYRIREPLDPASQSARMLAACCM